MLQKMVAARPDDPFPKYGLAMEFKKLERHDEAVAAFERLLDAHPGYVPSYLMFGNLLEALGRAQDAAGIYGRGIAAAEAAGDEHAVGELRAARDALG